MDAAEDVQLQPKSLAIVGLLEMQKKCAILPCPTVYIRNKKIMKIIRNFQRKDCIHFKEEIVEGCCGRKEKGGVCTVPDRYNNPTQRTCSMKMSWCAYQPKEEDRCSS